MDNLETILFQIISYVGSARSSYIEAIGKAREGAFDEVEQLMTQGREQFAEGHHAHLELIRQSAEGTLQAGEFQMLMMHAEDQLMSAETFGILADEFMELYKLLKKKDIIGATDK